MKQHFIYILFFIFHFSKTNAQFLTNDSYKYQTAQEVLETISRTKGDNRSVPILKISKEPLYIAKYFPGNSNHYIYLDEKVYDLCSSTGSDSLNALACIIGHELGHYYENHANNFGFSTVSEIHSQTTLEDEADKFGLFYGAVAGYKTHIIFPKILDKIYDSYKLSDNIKGYPPLNERKKIVQKAISEVEALINIYQMGQNLYAIHQYEASKSCLQFIINHFPSKLIHNNIGVCKLNMHLNSVKDQSLYPYIYPFEFDVRVKKKVTTELISRNMTFDLIDEAIQDFKIAIELDPNYEIAYINLACAYSIRGNQDAASGVIIDLKQKKNTLSENAYLIQGISKALNEDYTSAESIFKHLHSDSDINNYNKKVLKAEMNKEASYYDNFMEWVNTFFENENEIVNQRIHTSPETEKINNLLPDDLKITDQFHEVDLGNWAVLYYHDEGSVGKYIYRNKTTEVCIIQTFDNHQSSSSKDISIGDDMSKVTNMEHYGFPTFRWNNRPYTILTYYDTQLGFTFENKKVVNWFRWSIQN